LMLQVCCNKHSRWDYKYKSDGDRDEIEAACLKKHKTDERKDNEKAIHIITS